MDKNLQNNYQSLDEPIKTGPKKSAVLGLVALIVVAVLAVVAALLVKTYVIATYEVDGHSMDPTLDGGVADARDDGEILLLDRVAKIKYYDIVVVRIDGDNLVKRVVALSGDTVRIQTDTSGVTAVLVNGETLDEPYINEAMIPTFPGDMRYSSMTLAPYTEGIIAAYELTLGGDEVFCLGDNRNLSRDCRQLGAIPLGDVEGKCFAVLDKDGGIRFPKNYRY
jgi:signal peptidase I